MAWSSDVDKKVQALDTEVERKRWASAGHPVRHVGVYWEMSSTSPPYADVFIGAKGMHRNSDRCHDQCSRTIWWPCGKKTGYVWQHLHRSAFWLRRSSPCHCCRMRCQAKSRSSKPGMTAGRSGRNKSWPVNATQNLQTPSQGWMRRNDQWQYRLLIAETKAWPIVCVWASHGRATRARAWDHVWTQWDDAALGGLCIGSGSADLVDISIQALRYFHWIDQVSRRWSW